MKTVKYYKNLLDMFPDDTPVSLGDTYDCDFETFSFDTSQRVLKLHLTDGFGIVKKSFIDKLFEDLKNK